MTQNRITRAKEDVVLAARRYVSSLRHVEEETNPAEDYETLAAAVDALDSVEVQAIGDENGAYAKDSATSIVAANLSGPMAGTVRRRIIDEIRCAPESLYGLTTDELEVALRKSHTTVSSAVNYLMSIGWLRDSGYQRITRGGRPAMVLELTPQARERCS